jgi:hypothetical protein
VQAGAPPKAKIRRRSIKKRRWQEIASAFLRSWGAEKGRPLWSKHGALALDAPSAGTFR